MNAIEHLETTAWTTPDDYAGFNPVGDFVVLTRTRDSNLLDQCNWDLISDLLLEFTDTDNACLDYSLDSDDICYTWRANHWACGWVEYLMISKNAPDSIKELAGKIVCDLANYPVFDDDYYSERQSDLAYDRWHEADTSERIDLCKDAGVSIFAARSDDIPEKVHDEITQSEYCY
jgi:hypothetical protein